jgi:hypothetical protein
MSTMNVFAAACLVVVTAFPALADNVPSLKPGESIIIMPDGHMAIVKVTDLKTMIQLKEGIKPLGNCSMFMAAADGRLWLVNTERHKPMEVCEELAH